MDIEKLEKHLAIFQQKMKSEKEHFTSHYEERIKRVAYYRSFNASKIQKMNPDDFEKYLGDLWAMIIWGNKKYVVEKMISDNGINEIRISLSDLLWGLENIEQRWNSFIKKIKGIGPAMMSELLCLTHPDEYIIWNKRAFAGLQYLNVKNLPVYNYQCTGKKYIELCSVEKTIAQKMKDMGFTDISLLAVDYFIWDELQVEEPIKQLSLFNDTVKQDKIPDDSNSDFIHNEIRDKLANIGSFLGFNTYTEKKVAEGSKVDTVWEATIGNMGRIIYVFEVQTKGSLDSLSMNLLKSLNNPAVQGVVAVSDSKQLDKIEQYTKEIPNLKNKLKLWNYKEVLDIHDSLEYINESINKLDLVPKGF